MAADIINLRQARKRRQRVAEAAEAAENRTRFGRTRAERERDELAESQAKRTLDGHLREREADAADAAAPPDPAPKPSR